MTVYVVKNNSYEDIAICSTREIAESLLKLELNKYHHSKYIDGTFIEEVEVDKYEQ